MSAAIIAAFDRVLEASQELNAALRTEGAEHFRRGEDASARRALQSAKRLARILAALSEMRREWLAGTSGGGGKLRGKKPPPRLRRGLRTPQEAFRIPILEALVELGGRGTVQAVLDRVEQKMANALNEFDRAPLPSAPRTPRWRNAARWCRLLLVR
jgi:hypothetical protein